MKQRRLQSISLFLSLKRTLAARLNQMFSKSLGTHIELLIKD